MTRELDLYQIDAFSEQIFGGNPAAVCPLPEGWLPDETMQAIAAENNLSETAFLVAEKEGYAIRWFTPLREVDLCGHATLASGYVVMNDIEPSRDHVQFNSRSGPLRVSRDGDWLLLDLPALPPEPLREWTAVTEALGSEPREVWQSKKLLALLDSQSEVLASAPDLTKVAALPADGLIVTAMGEDCDFVSRYFAPAAGIPEDPVTGSAHSILAPFWAARLGKERMLARQVSRRGGLLRLELKGERVLIAGRVAPFLRGKITI